MGKCAAAAHVQHCYRGSRSYSRVSVDVGWVER